MKETTLKKVNAGDFFKFSANGRVFVRGEYERSSKTFSYYPFDDVNNEHFAKGTRKVFIDFEF